LDRSGTLVAQGAVPEVRVPALGSREVGQISWECSEPGAYRLAVEFAGSANEWPLNVFAACTEAELSAWGIAAQSSYLEGLRMGGTESFMPFPGAEVSFMSDAGTVPMPFWRECALEFKGDAWGLTDRWERLLAISPDRALDPASLPEGYETIINRIDTRTYREHPIAVRKDRTILTTLRPAGGLGIEPLGIARNPSGVELIRSMLATLH
jgi:hypothetical protein